jgi:predicted nucleotidyltransferase
MKFGLTDSEFDFLKKTVIDPLKRQGCKVWIFGSRARGQQQPFSDVDILFEPPVDVLLPSALISEMKEQAEESRLNYKIDLVSVSHLAESYKPSVFKDRVEV